jgi:transposase
MEKERKLARERASIILQVRSGALTTTEGAERLGVSRKTYYEWEDRALEAMALALENHPPGRPPTLLDMEKEELQRKVRDLEKKLYLAEKTIEVKDLLSAYECFRAGGAKKNQGKKQKAGKRRSAD